MNDSHKKTSLFFEIILIFFWTIVVTHPYINLDENRIPHGSDWSEGVRTNRFWIDASKCGLCALWEGSVEGGAPAFVDVYSSKFHPVTAVMTLLFGVVNGAKFTLVISFFLAGIGQWWLARQLGAGGIVRVWSSFMGVAAGNLSGKMEAADNILVLSTASYMLLLPALIRVMQSRSYRAVVVASILLTLFIISGNGYLQVGFLFLTPLFILLFRGSLINLVSIIKRITSVLLISFLLCSFFLIPFFHYLPNFQKTSDQTFKHAQPFGSVLLNLIISDHSYYYGKNFKTFAAPSFYENYIGWIPIVFAFGSILMIKPRNKKRMILFLCMLCLASLWMASAQPFTLILKYLPGLWIMRFLPFVRFPFFISSLAIAPLLGLSAMGLDYFLKTSFQGIREFRHNQRFITMVHAVNVGLMAVMLLLSVTSVWTFGRKWIYSETIPKKVFDMVAALKTSRLEWVQTPKQQQYFEPATRYYLKISDATRRWGWASRTLPAPLLSASYNLMCEKGQLIGIGNGLGMFQHPGNEYAVIAHQDGTRSICDSTGIGGNIEVHCDHQSEGVLTVKENYAAGWNAWVNGIPVRFKEGSWISMEIPAGSSLIQLQYRPQEVWWGVLISDFGLLFCLLFWLKKRL